MSDDSVIANCCAAAWGICCLACCESFLVSINFKRPGTGPGSTQRGCCKNLGESTEDDEFEEGARRERLAKSSKKRKNRDKNPDGGNEEKNAKENEGGGDRPVDEQPGASPEMSADTADATTRT